MTRLENWKFSNYINWFQYPTEDKLQLIGEIRDDLTGRFADGTTVRTSEVLTFDVDKLIVETLNTTYKLGLINEEFSEFIGENGFLLSNYARKLTINSSF